jgi:hypothetical protein
MKERYLSDNPFRLLGVSSSCTYVTLRRTCDRVTKQLSVGIEHPIPLSEQFGTEDLDNIASTVRSIAEDHTERTVYRILWPLAEEGVSLVVKGNKSRANWVASFCGNQVGFLESWYSFLNSQEEADLEAALTAWAALSQEPEFSDRLCSLLVEEGCDNRSHSGSVVVRALELTTRYVTNRAMKGAAQLARDGEVSSACKVVRAVLDSPVDEHIGESSLTPIIQVGDSLAELIEEAASGFTWKTENPPSECLSLSLLAGAVGERHPCTKTWMNTIRESNSCLVTGWINRAVEYANDENDYRRAYDLLDKGKSLTITEEVSERLRRNMVTVRESLTAPPKPVQPANKSPRSIPAARPASIPMGCVLWAVVLIIGGVSSLFPHGTANRSQDSKEVSGPLTVPATPTPQVENSIKEESSNAAPLQSSPTDTTVEKKEKPTINVQQPVNQGAEKLQREQDALVKEVDAERPRIKSEQSELASEKRTIDTDKKVLDSESSALDEQSSALDATKAELDSSNPDTSDPEQLSAYNRQVDRYNLRVSLYRTNAESYKSHLANFNARVDLYNEKLAQSKEHLTSFNAKVDRINELSDQINSLR